MKNLTIPALFLSFVLLLMPLLPKVCTAAQVTETVYLQSPANISQTPPAEDATINLPQTFTDGQLLMGNITLPAEVQGSVVLKVCTLGIFRPDVDFSITLLRNGNAVGNTVITVKQDGCCFPSKNYEDFSISLTETISAGDAISLSIEPSSRGTRSLLVEAEAPEANSLTFTVVTPSPGKKVVIVPAISLLLLNKDSH